MSEMDFLNFTSSVSPPLVSSSNLGGSSPDDD
eukprot:SAG31_NODE_4334_length_3344_cov_4.039753_4_plen_32_part_00